MKAWKATDRQLSPHFNELEFACHCCGMVKVDTKLVNKLEKLRMLVNAPVTLTCGYRCPSHNTTVGGVSGSEHMEGTAADIIIGSLSPANVAKLAEKVSFNGIGTYPTFTHVDIRKKKARWNG